MSERQEAYLMICGSENRPGNVRWPEPDPICPRCNLPAEQLHGEQQLCCTCDVAEIRVMWRAGQLPMLQKRRRAG